MTETDAADLPDLARRVLGADKVGRDLNNAASWDAVDLVLENAPALAHAVIELTAKAKRVEDLADRLEHEAAYEASRGDTWDATCIRAEARRIRRALNGETA